MGMDARGGDFEVMDGLLLEQFRLYVPRSVSPIKQLHSHPSIRRSVRPVRSWRMGRSLPLIPLFLFPHLSRSSRFRIPCPLFFHEVSLLSTLYSPENTTSKRFTIKKHGRCFCNTAATWRDRFATDCVISTLRRLNFMEIQALPRYDHFVTMKLREVGQRFLQT